MWCCCCSAETTRSYTRCFICGACCSLAGSLSALPSSIPATLGSVRPPQPCLLRPLPSRSRAARPSGSRDVLRRSCQIGGYSLCGVLFFASRLLERTMLPDEIYYCRPTPLEQSISQSEPLRLHIPNSFGRFKGQLVRKTMIGMDRTPLFYVWKIEEINLISRSGQQKILLLHGSIRLEDSRVNSFARWLKHSRVYSFARYWQR